MRRLATLSVLMLAASAAVSAADTHPFSVHDMIAMDRISDPQISPDANRIAFVVSALDLAANKRRTDLYLVNADGSGLRRMTSHEASDTSPRWSPDGRTIYFLSTRSGSSQVWKLAADGGEATAVTKLPLDVGAFLLSPDGSRLAVAMDVFPACAGLECTTKRIEANAARKSSGLIFDSLFMLFDQQGNEDEYGAEPNRACRPAPDARRLLDMGPELGLKTYCSQGFRGSHPRRNQVSRAGRSRQADSR